MKRFFFLLLLISPCLANAEITGPDSAKAGEMAVFNSNVETAWTIVPETYSASFYVDSSKKTLVFSSPVEGVVTIIGASITAEGGPTIEKKVFYNGVDIPNPSPAPSPTPAPVIKDLKSVAKSEGEGVSSANKNKEVEAIVESFRIASDGINRGVITTPQGARYTLRSSWSEKANAISPESLKTWEKFFDEISEYVSTDDLTKIKNDFNTIADILEELKASKKTESKTTETEKPKAGNCANGQCNTTTTRRRWQW